MAKKKEEVVDVDCSPEKAVTEVATEKETMFRVNLPFELNIGGVQYLAGSHVVNMGLMEVMREMADKGSRAKIAAHTGKNYLVERLMDNRLSVTEVGALDRRLR